MSATANPPGDEHDPNVAVLVPTRWRLRHLRIALRSIGLQTLAPVRVLVVGEDREDLPTEDEQRQWASELRPAHVEWLTNERDPGVAGALNTALARLLAECADPTSTYVALLDDDDSWDHKYLQRSLQAAVDSKADVVVSGIVRHEDESSQGRPQSVPEVLRVEDFLVGNPHVQNSNLVVRLSTLLEAGALDEFLPSTLDRDLAIRLLDLGDVRVVRVDEPLVHHWALGHPRLSTPGSSTKKLGLERFLRKHGHRMTVEERGQFLRRAKELFGVSLPCAPGPASLPSSPVILPEPKSRRADIVIGVTVTHTVAARRLMEDLGRHFDHKPWIRRIVICDNFSETGRLEDAVRPLIEADLPLRFVSSGEIEAAALEGRLGSYYIDPNHRRGIAFGRTALHSFLLEEAASFDNPIVWVLDDDVRLDDIRFGDSRQIESAEDLVDLFCRLRELGHSAVVGGTWGDPPLPAGVLLRTQLLDLSENLRAFATRGQSLLPPVQDDETYTARFPEYYYDASLRHRGHLELPFGVPAEARGESGLACLEEMLRRVPEILTGREVFRTCPPGFSVPPGLGLPNRGGNTLVFDLRLLANYPNVAPQIGGIDSRRGDTFWCILSSAEQTAFSPRLSALPIGCVPLFVRHERSVADRGPLTLVPVVADALGRAFTRAVNEAINRAPSEGSVPSAHNLPAAVDPLEMFCQARTAISEVFVARTEGAVRQIEMNAWRIRGLVRTIRHQLKTRESWSADASAVVNRHLDRISSTLDAIELAFSGDSVRMGVAYLDKGVARDVVLFLEDLPQIVSSYRQRNGAILDHGARTRDLRLIRAEFHAVDPFFVGAGKEGRVYRDGSSAFKVFEDDTLQDSVETLTARLPRPDEPSHLLPILDVRLIQGRLAIRVPFVEGTRYAGGRLSELLALVRECRRRDLVLTNLHPENILTTAHGLWYVDIGRSIIPYDPMVFREMCKRAYLCYRWYFRPDLKNLMARSLYDENLPELTGFEEFLGAVDHQDIHDVLDDSLLEELARAGVSSVLDFGCGRGGLTSRLATAGYRVTAYDPDAVSLAETRRRLPAVEVLDRPAFDGIRASGRKFEAVVCSLVLCSIVNEREAELAIEQVRGVLEPGGVLLLALCDPFSLDVRESTVAVKVGSVGPDYRGRPLVEKRVNRTGRTRLDRHRPLAWYAGVLHRAGFTVESSWGTPGIDVPALSPCSDVRLVAANLVGPVSREPGVTLLIRTCSMEWETIEFQIRHIVGQLEGPRRFVEKIVVYDRRAGPFARQYAPGNPEALERTLLGLVDEGVVDRIVCADCDGGVVAAVYQRWFGASAKESLSSAGQPIAATLQGFEACRTAFVLQMDSDCLIGRRDRGHDYLGEMLEVFARDETALTVSMSVPFPERVPYTPGPGGASWRTEVRCSLLALDRLHTTLPLSNSVGPDGRLELNWHRSLDELIGRSAFRSYRGGDPRSWFVHLPNDRKPSVTEWYNIAKAIERGQFYTGQLGRVDLTGSLGDWLGRRGDEMVIIVRGKNVPISKIERCIRSIEKQDTPEWGVVFIDGGSSNGMAEYLSEVVAPRMSNRATVYLNYRSLPVIENNVVAIRELCSNPDSVIVTLDADDQFIGARALSRIIALYRQGADVTVGSMLRTDKVASYPVDFTGSRSTRGGGNVWQHLRTFRKRLFDRIREEDLMIDGRWIPDAEDWAYMLPIVEMAQHPVHVRDTLYWYEPSPEKMVRGSAEREAIIAGIVGKPSYGAGP
ncbi:MAG TPA: glycosyltransferase [Thermoplasmata archaeon]|nr:glycosyltransferase [Thermoplasmata archaeon]